MKRLPLLLTLCAAFALPAAGCSKKDKGTTHPDEAAESDVDPLEELQSIPGQIQAEVDVVLQPITDVDVVIDKIAAMPSELGVDATALRGMCKASLSGEGAELDVDIDADAKAQVQAVLETVKGIGAGLKETPARAKTATANIVKLGTKATGLVTKLQTKYQAKLANPFTKAEEKAQIQAELDLVLEADADIKATVGEAKQTVMSLPKKGGEALAKITKAFAGGASTDDGAVEAEAG
jgi:hypothetical protein